MKKVSKKKEVLNSDLALAIKNLSLTVEDLTVITAKGFSSIEERLQAVEKELVTKASKTDILNIRDNFTSRYHFDRLSLRVIKLEEKAKK